ncbi:MAG: dihydrofolate reductase [Bacteroidales bacterium]
MENLIVNSMHKNVIMIAAVAKNLAIGKNNELLWHLSEDLQHFKQITSGNTVIMGRKTFESIGKALPNRHNFVLSTQKILTTPNVSLFSSLEEAIAKAPTLSVFIIGGERVYQEALKLATDLYITHIEQEDKEADTFFPPIDCSTWIQIERSATMTSKEGVCFYFAKYKRLQIVQD